MRPLHGEHREDEGAREGGLRGERAGARARRRRGGRGARPGDVLLARADFSAVFAAIFTFFFSYDDTTPGDHTIVIEAIIDEAVGAEGESTVAGDQGAQATLGKGSLSIEEVRLVHGANGESIDF